MTPLTAWPIRALETHVLSLAHAIQIRDSPVTTAMVASGAEAPAPMPPILNPGLLRSLAAAFGIRENTLVRETKCFGA